MPAACRRKEDFSIFLYENVYPKRCATAKTQFVLLSFDAAFRCVYAKKVNKIVPFSQAVDNPIASSFLKEISLSTAVRGEGCCKNLKKRFRTEYDNGCFSS